MGELLQETLKLLGVSIITSVVTVRLSLRQFRSERWWEQKAEAYSRILEHLANVDLYVTRWLRNEYTGRGMSDPIREELADTRVEASKELDKAVSIGPYIISDAAAKALRSMKREMQSADMESLPEAVEAERSAVRECIKKVRNEARNDLKPEWKLPI